MACMENEWERISKQILLWLVGTSVTCINMCYLTLSKYKTTTTQNKYFQCLHATDWNYSTYIGFIGHRVIFRGTQIIGHSTVCSKALCRETDGFPSRKGSGVHSVSNWWRHIGSICSVYSSRLPHRVRILPLDGPANEGILVEDWSIPILYTWVALCRIVLWSEAVLVTHMLQDHFIGTGSVGISFVLCGFPSNRMFRKPLYIK